MVPSCSPISIAAKDEHPLRFGEQWKSNRKPTGLRRNCIRDAGLSSDSLASSLPSDRGMSLSELCATDVAI